MLASMVILVSMMLYENVIVEQQIQALWLYELVTEQQPLWRSMKLFDCNKTLDYDTEVVFEQENIRLEHRRH